jgi:Undecaprenyl-phosphate glucose phosphotransferase
MLKQRRQIFEVFFIGADLAVVSVAWLLAYWLRFKTSLVPVEKGVPDFGQYVSLLIYVWLIYLFVFKKVGLYQPMRGVRRVKELFMLINGNALAVLLLIAVTYLFREKSVPYSRLVFFYFGALAFLLTVIERMSVRSFLREVRRRGYNLRYMLLVGDGRVAADVIDIVRKQQELGIQLVGCVSKEVPVGECVHGLPVVGQYDELGQILDRLAVDQVVLALPIADSPLIPDLMNQVRDSLVDVRIVPDLYRFISLGGYIQEFEGLPIVGLQESPINLTAKRAVDLAIGSVVTLAFTPVMLIIAVLIKCTSRGSVIYRQERVSYDGSPFTILKFRTMVVNAEQSGPGWTTPGDGRVTWLGRILRSTSLDELPQLFNVLRGDMSIIGPRPERPVFIKEFRTQIPRYMLRHKVPAGITGWAQVHGWRGDTSIDKRLEYDLYYVENWSLLLDLQILFMTVFRGFRHSNAY